MMAISSVVAKNDPLALRALLMKLDRQTISQCQDSQAALYLAAASGYTACTRLLLDHGVPVDSCGITGDTPLTLASRYNQIANIKTILEYKANIYTRNGHSETAMDIACRNGYREIIELLLKEFCKTPQTDSEPTRTVGKKEMRYFSYTALIAAVTTGQLEVLNKLLSAGFNPNLNRDSEIGTPLHAAIDAGSVCCADLLIKAGAQTDALRACCTPMVTCAENNQVGIARLLLDAGCDVNQYNEHCSSPLTIACHYGSAEMAEFLLDNGADADAVNSWGFTALFMAVDSPHILRRVLLEHVQVDVLCGERGEGAIHLAALIGSTESVCMLLEKGADINLKTPYNESAVWVAVWKRHSELVRLLIAWNCYLDLPSDGCRQFAWKYLPLEVAMGSEQYEVARMLVQAGCATRNCLYFPVDDSTSGPLKDLPMLRLRRETLMYLERKPHEKKWFMKYFRNPTSLKHLCRLNIRQNLTSVNYKNKVRTLPMPHILKQYINFCDL